MDEKVTEEKKSKNPAATKYFVVITAALGALHLILMLITSLRNEANYSLWGMGAIALIVVVEIVLAALYGKKVLKKLWLGVALIIAAVVASFFIPACDYTRYSGCEAYCAENDINCDCLTSGGDQANIYGF